VGIIQTLLTAGIVFGWASLLPILRDEGVQHTPQEFASIFTCGAIGNYLSTLLFGVTLDRRGPRTTAILASLLFGLGLVLCSDSESYSSLLMGFGLLGFSGPGIQMPTLHLANLFSDGGIGGSAVYMSSQAAAFDGGTVVFALVRLLHKKLGLSTATFFWIYLVVPGSVLLTAIFVWPDDVLESPNPLTEEMVLPPGSPYVGPASSPYLSPRIPRRTADSSTKPLHATTSLVNAPLSVILWHPSFWTLATWVSVHILKLNFVVATLNDQLKNTVNEDQAESLINVFGAMLPFGFVALPLVAWLLNQSTIWVIQLANLVGLVYGAILVWFPSSTKLLSLVVFPAVATSRQMVYSTVFHQIGAAFGFSNYGVLLGLTNIVVSSFSLLQTPLVSWSERQGDYTSANAVLLILTLPLFFVGFWANLTTSVKQPTTNEDKTASEEGQTLLAPGRKPRSYSSAQ
jgi:MFS family permease